MLAKTDNRVKKLESEMQVLIAVGRCAYLRASELARLVWPNGTGKSPIRLAQRATKALKETGELLVTKVQGATIFYLTEKGARRLIADGHDAKSWKDAIRSLKNFAHRCKCNSAFIQAELAGHKKNFTEHEILGHRGVVFQWHGKRPDLLVWSKVDNCAGWWWTEVENTARNAKDFERLNDWLRQGVHPLAREKAYPLAMGASQDEPLLGIVMLASTTEELERLRNRLRTAIAQWIDSLDGNSHWDETGSFNNAGQFICSFVHFVLLDDFGKWLRLDDPELY